MTKAKRPLDAFIVAVPETAGSALYGMVDVLSATGNIWQALSRTGGGETLVRPWIVSTTKRRFLCGNTIPVEPALDIRTRRRPDLVILPELWLGPDEDLHGRYPDLIDWINNMYKAGSYIYSACSGAIMLAETGLLNGREATSHWGYQDLFRKRFPEIRFKPEPNLCFADPGGRVVTAGGTTSWHDLAIHIIARHCSPGEALNIAKVYLLKWHGEGQLPYATLIRHNPHADSAVRNCENWLAKHFREKNCITQVVKFSKIPERSLKRRFKSATGSSLIEYIQNQRIEEAKRLLETDDMAVEEISNRVGYEDAAFFRRLFKRTTGLRPGQYRKMFRPVAEATRDVKELND
ncbi:MAG TPA: helix-turn-helix domain-containing protein [Gammaproteobacteria bacterium]